MTRLPQSRHASVLASGPVRLVSLAVAGAVVAGLGATDVRTPAPEALASAASVGTSDHETSDATRAAIVRSTTTVATRAAFASPAVTSLPTTATTAADLPVAALNAYERAAEVIDSVRPGCHLGWSVLAAIGQVESDHGRSAGGLPGVDGTTTQPIRGAVLDGSGARARVADTDGGQLDGISTWDRAVGPMQFLPSTWISVRVDGDGDGVRSPDDLDDATLAAGVFLCAWDDDLSTPTGAVKAVGHYNSTRGYAPAVLSLARTYESGSYLTYGWTSIVASTWSGSMPPIAEAAGVPALEDAGSETRKPLPVASTAAPTSEQPSAAAVTTPTPVPASGASPTATPSETPASDSPSPTPSPSADPSAAPSPAESPTPSPTEEPSPTATPSPTPSGDGSAGPSTVAGALQSCGDQGFCVGDQVLDFGVLSSPAGADFDGDGSTGSKQAELTGLVGTQVTVTLDGPKGAVLTVNGLTWSS